MSDTPPRIGVLVNNVGGYSRGVIRGIASFATARGWECRTQDVNATDLPLARRKYDGLIIQAGVADLQRLISRVRGPVVNVSSAMQASPVPSVVTDDVAVGRIGADLFAQRGYRRAIFYSPDDRHFAALRHRGFVERLPFAALCRTPAELKRALGQEHPPVGLMGCNDRAALAALDLLRGLGREVPRHVAVLGVDNDDLMQSLARPALSTINTSKERIGFEAAALLERQMLGERVGDEPVRIAPRGIILRRSTDAVAVPDDAVAEALQFIEHDATRRVSVDDVAEHVTISRRQLERRFRQTLGRSIREELERCRLDRARQLLLDTDLTLPQVADASGFGSASYFCTLFKAKTGGTPQELRRRFGGLDARNPDATG
ncbi:MAG: substrate-binding domain-containing protein [Planctomycetota bacterium]